MANLEHKLPAIKADWACRGYSFEYWIDPPGQTWRNFVHEVDELVMLIEGEIELDLNGSCVRPPVGKEILIPARTRHTVTNVGSTPNRWCFGYKNRES